MEYHDTATGGSFKPVAQVMLCEIGSKKVSVDGRGAVESTTCQKYDEKQQTFGCKACKTFRHQQVLLTVSCGLKMLLLVVLNWVTILCTPGEKLLKICNLIRRHEHKWENLKQT